MNDEIALQSAIALRKAYLEGRLGGDVMPEDCVVELVDDRSVLADILTLGMVLNYQRNSYALWKAIADCWRRPEERWVFDIQIVRDCEFDELQQVLVPARIALQSTRHCLNWQRVAGAVGEWGSTLGLMDEAGRDVRRLREIVQVENRKKFPYLSGPKIFNYWLCVLDSYHLTSLVNRSLITVAPDTHVVQGTIRLGLMTRVDGESDSEMRNRVAKRWAEILIDADFDMIDIHTQLWLWSRAGFPPIEGVECVSVDDNALLF